MSSKKALSTTYLLPLASVAFFVVALNVMILSTNKPQRINSQAAAPNEKVTICHVPSGNPEKSVVISISANAWENGHDIHNNHRLDYLITEGRSCPEIDE